MDNNTDGCGYELWETSDSEDDAVDVSNDKLNGAHHLCVNGDNAKSSGESESLSDIDDAEVDTYLNDDREQHYKKIIWEKLNQKYLQEQETKRCPAAANVPKPKREQRNRKAKGADKAQPTAETAQPASNKKRASSRVNYDALSKLLDEPLSSDNPKRSRTESDSDQNVVNSSVGFQVTNDELTAAGENEDDENGWEENQDDYSYYNNQEEENDYYFDDGLF